MTGPAQHGDRRPDPGPTDPGRTAPGPAVPASPVAPGLLWAAFSSASFGLVITLTGIAYKGGASPGAVMGIRLLVAILVMAALVRALGRGFRPPSGLGRGLFLVALSNFGVTLGYMTSIVFIPVSLAAIIFYTYPLMVVAVAPVLQNTRLGQKTRLGLRQFAAFGLAFAGLVLALGPSVEVLDWRGVALALLAAVSATSVFITSPRVVGAYHAVGVSLYTNVIGACLVPFFLTSLGGIVLPGTAPGWLGLGGVVVLYICAVLAMFLALHAAGAVRTSLIFNLEPVVAIGAAAVLLGERLTPLQLGGVALVIGALMLAGLARARA